MDIIFEIFQMKRINSLVSRGEGHLKSFPESRAKPLSQRTIAIFDGCEYDAAILHVGRNT